jgi:hypothetical protein
MTGFAAGPAWASSSRYRVDVTEPDITVVIDLAPARAGFACSREAINNAAAMAQKIRAASFAAVALLASIRSAASLPMIVRVRP